MKSNECVSKNDIPFDYQCIENVRARLNWKSKDRVLNPFYHKKVVPLNKESYANISKENFDRYNSYPTKKSLFSQSIYLSLYIMTRKPG